MLWMAWTLEERAPSTVSQLRVFVRCELFNIQSQQKGVSVETSETPLDPLLWGAVCFKTINLGLCKFSGSLLFK